MIRMIDVNDFQTATVSFLLMQINARVDYENDPRTQTHTHIFLLAQSILIKGTYNYFNPSVHKESSKLKVKFSTFQNVNLAIHQNQ